MANGQGVALSEADSMVFSARHQLLEETQGRYEKA